MSPRTRQDPYVLYVGNLLPHKNLPRLLDAFALLRRRQACRLIIRGEGRPAYARLLRERIESLGLHDAIAFAGYTGEDGLRQLYADAACLVLPSLGEGFGLPVLEAMACGTPVITASASSLPEVAGDAALMVDPYDCLDLADAMYRTLTDNGLREDLRAAGLAAGRGLHLEANGARGVPGARRELSARAKRTVRPYLCTTVRERFCLLALLGLACLAGPAGAEPLYEWQWTIAPGILLSNQAPTIAALPDGALLVCWAAGSTEKARDVQIYCSRSGPGSRSWERPRPVVQRGEHAQGSWLRNLTLGNPVLLLDHQRYLWLFYAAVDAPLGWSGSHVDYKVSNDLGKTWGSSRRLVAAWGNLPRNSALALGSDGRVLLPVYHELFGTHGYVLELKINHGHSRGSNHAVFRAAIISSPRSCGPGRGGSSPT